MIKICKNTKCHKELTNGKRIWCSDDCRNKQSHVLPRILKCKRKSCENEFMAKSSQKKFCSVECRKKNLNENKRIVKFESPMRIINLTSNNYTFAFKGYFINKSGQIFNKHKKKIKPYVSGNKYRVKLGTEDYDLQSLVAKLFIENPESYRHIESIDGNLKNVKSSNLK